jgi:hypothetical protein
VPTDEEINNNLLAIYSKLGVIEGKVNLVARAHKQTSLESIEAAIRKKPLLGQIYLVLNGVRTQTEVLDKLREHGIDTNAMAVSRAMEKLEREYGMADLVSGGAAKVFRKDAEAERVLNLSANIRKWLADEGKTVPEDGQRRRRRKMDG